MQAEAFGDLALGLPEAAQSSHMGAVDFRVRGKIFAQPSGKSGGSAIVKLTREQQDLMCAAEPGIFTPEPGHWGRLGWTRFAVDSADEATALSALWTAWRNVAPKALSKAHTEGLAPRLRASASPRRGAISKSCINNARDRGRNSV